MAYARVIPRDLFNESNLLKCYGQMYLNLEWLGLEGALIDVDTEGGFRIEQNQDSGGLWLANVLFVLRGVPHRLERPLNSRRPFPLYLLNGDDPIEVFNDDGSFTEDMLRTIQIEEPRQ